MKKLKIDWNNLIDAFGSEQEDYRCYLDTSSGDVAWKNIEIVENSEKGLDKKFIAAPHISSREGWDLMMDFIANVTNKQLKTKLQNVVQGKGAFKKFKEILSKFSNSLDDWYIYQDAAYTKLLNEWLQQNDIESTNTPLYKVKVGDRVTLDTPPFGQDIMDTILFTADFLIGNESKTFLGLVLKGSKAKAVKDKGGDALPGYGELSKLTIKQVNEYLDKAVQTQWLECDTSNSEDGVLGHSLKGWERVKEIWAEKLFEQLKLSAQNENPEEFINLVMGRHREIRQNFLDLLFRKATAEHLPALELWKNEEVRKFKKRLQGLIRKVSGVPQSPYKKPDNRRPQKSNKNPNQRTQQSRNYQSRNQQNRKSNTRPQSNKPQYSRNQKRKTP